MAYQGITLSSIRDVGHQTNYRRSATKTAYNLFAVFALLVAAGVVASAYHPIDGSVSNPRLNSVSAFHAPTMFRGAPHATGFGNPER